MCAFSATKTIIIVCSVPQQLLVPNVSTDTIFLAQRVSNVRHPVLYVRVHRFVLPARWVSKDRVITVKSQLQTCRLVVYNILLIPINVKFAKQDTINSLRISAKLVIKVWLTVLNVLPLILALPAKRDTI